MVEEGFSLFSKFTLKVTHAAATTLQLLANVLEEDSLGKEDLKLVYGFLIKDWAKVLLDGNERKKMPLSALLFSLVFGTLLVYTLHPLVMVLFFG